MTTEAHRRNDFVTASNKFAFSLAREVVWGREHMNQVVSPFSIESILLLALQGARGETATEMATAMALSPIRIRNPKSKNPALPLDLDPVSS